MTPEVQRQRPRELGIESLRGVAALMVFIYHLRWQAGEPVLRLAGIDWQPVMKRLDVGVSLFFVLSGYLLSGPFWEAMKNGGWPDLKKYAVRRMARILPAYWVVLIAIGLLSPYTYTLWGMVGMSLQAIGVHTFADYVYLGGVPVLWSIALRLSMFIGEPRWLTVRRVC